MTSLLIDGAFIDGARDGTCILGVRVWTDDLPSLSVTFPGNDVIC